MPNPCHSPENSALTTRVSWLRRCRSLSLPLSPPPLSLSLSFSFSVSSSPHKPPRMSVCPRRNMSCVAFIWQWFLIHHCCNGTLRTLTILIRPPHRGSWVSSVHSHWPSEGWKGERGSGRERKGMMRKPKRWPAHVWLMYYYMLCASGCPLKLT